MDTGGVALLLLAFVGCFGITVSRGVDLGLCSNETVDCACGSAGLQIQVPIERCTFFYHWKPFCKACEEYNKTALCSQFKQCLSCNEEKDGGCSSCPVGRYGKHCLKVCQCQNGGGCHQTNGKCDCPRPYTGRFCEKSLRLGVSVNCAVPAFDGQMQPVRSSYAPGSTITLCCNSGFKLEGTSKLSCLSSGQWDAPVPACVAEITNCPELQAPENGNIRTPNVGQKVQFSCSDGFILGGSRERECLPDGSWSGTVTRCTKPTTCADPGTPKNAERLVSIPASGPRSRPPGSSLRRGRGRLSLTANSSGDHFVINTEITFTCTPDVYDLVGSQKRSCQSNGQWSGDQPRCVPVCGMAPVRRHINIIRQEVSPIGDYPWQAFLSHDFGKGEFIGVCGGSLVDENTIVTAAHCVTVRDTTTLLANSILKVYLGKYYRNDSRDDDFVQEFSVTEIHVHPNYDPLLLDSDIAVLTLSRSAKLSNRVMPICLPDIAQSKAMLSLKAFLTVTGWGETEDRVESEVLRSTRLQVISNKACEDRYAYAGLPLLVTEDMFCAGHDEARGDSCVGDSGGPAVSFEGSGLDRKWYLVGIGSWGSPVDCGIPNHYSGFTRITRFLSFIESNSGSSLGVSVNCAVPAFDGQMQPVRSSYAPGSTITLCCNNGFKLEGTSKLSCQPSGQWDAPVPACVAEITNCPELQAPENGKIRRPNVGQKVQFSCSDGFILGGSRERECLPDGSWSGTVTRCTETTTCADPGTPKNAERLVSIPASGPKSRPPGSSLRLGRGRLSPTANSSGDHFVINTEITFTCTPDVYDLVGSEKRSCQSNGQWSGDQPRCVPVCGMAPVRRYINIIRQEVSPIGDYPWQAFLSHDFGNGEFIGVCGGSLVDENTIVTAAHCVTVRDTTTLLANSILKVYLGKYYRNDSRDDDFVQEFSVTEIHVHPNYDPLLLDSDIAVLRLSRSAKLSNRVMPICLPDIAQSKAMLSLKAFLTVTGWGETEDRVESEVLRSTRLQVISNKACEDRYAYAGLPLLVTEDMFCAGHEEARGDSCVGDSGGPAVSFEGSGLDRKWYLVGIGSWGSPVDCGIPNHYSGFTRITRFLSFIESNSGLS